eukprot:CAMPEP_0206145450 /NCGR_PEP_ID=MMETSP1473-20131121/27392_1 /ASSEMBLY_ACC=CAM_ASM_001109 /TAXON_ID=1461547 /ORGANISM="Stichococcus sp, Strain RCC1054" /LENGTH=285 /DNA_ID=CAMNT_0053541673 /DNA_START=179 /DNA_END=1036 /DNA_ORIENTATION=+
MAPKRKAVQATKSAAGDKGSTAASTAKRRNTRASVAAAPDAATGNSHRAVPATSKARPGTSNGTAESGPPAEVKKNKARKPAAAKKVKVEDSKNSESKGKPAAGKDNRLGGPLPEGMKPAELAKQTEYFLIKDEPSDYSIEDLAGEKNQTAEWDGVRNYTARNVMRQMKRGNHVLFYRSGTKDPGVVGLCEVAREPYADHTAWDSKSKYYDSKASPDDEPPRWCMVDVKLVRQFRRVVSLAEMKRHKEDALKGLALLHISRLSVMPITKQHFDFICDLEDSESEG